MSRRAKIVCTLGTGDRVRGAGRGAGRGGHGRGPAELQPRHPRRTRAARPSGCGGRRDRPAARSACSPTCRARRSGSARFADGPVEWRAGDRVTITTEDVPGTAHRVSTTYPRLADDVSPGDRLLVDDGNVGAGGRRRRADRDVVCEVTEGGPVSDHKGLSLPGIAVSEPALSGKDAEDLRFALALGVDLVALSFVRSAADAGPVRAVLAEQGRTVPVLAKLEKPEAVAELDAVLAAFDGIMVARGDLGVEMPLERVPLVQKRAVQACREAAKPAIVATQMLESMIEHPRPTRAEASTWPTRCWTAPTR